MSGTKSSLKSLLIELHNAMGVTGCEQEIVKLVCEKITPYADQVNVTTTGNIIAIKKGKKAGPKLLLGAHVDEIGFIVRHILPNGFLLFDKIGGVPENIILGKKVLVSSKRIPGVIGTKPGHLQTPEEAKTIQPVSKCYLDIGLNSAEEVKKYGIKVGDPIIFKSDVTEMVNPDLIATRAVDDRINCAVIIELFKTLSTEDFAGTIYAVFTVREEAGLLGARNAAFGLDIDYAIALDTIPAGDTPDIQVASQLPVSIGKGPAIPIADSVGFTFFQFIHPGLRKTIEQKAEAANINLQFCTIVGYMYATDAAAFSYANGGIPTATITVPRRYSHSPVELFNINDAVDVLTLLKAIIKDNENINLSFI